MRMWQPVREKHPWIYFWASRELLLRESLSVVAAVTYLKWKPGYGNSTKSDTGIRILLQRSVKYPCDKIKELMRCIWISRHWESFVKQKIRTVGNTWIGGYRIWISPGLIMVYKSDSRYEKYQVYFFTSPASRLPGQIPAYKPRKYSGEDGSLTIRTRTDVYEFELDASCVSEVDMILLLHTVNEYFRDDGM